MGGQESPAGPGWEVLRKKSIFVRSHKLTQKYVPNHGIGGHGTERCR